MNNSRTPPRIYLYVFLIVICMLGLIQGATTISSSRSLNQKAQDLVNHNSLGKPKAELSYSREKAPSLREMKELFLQDPTDKVAPQAPGAGMVYFVPTTCTPNFTVSPLQPDCSGSSTVSLTAAGISQGIGFQSFEVTALANAVVTIPPFPPGTFNPVTATWTPTGTPYYITFRVSSGNCEIFIVVLC